MALTINHQTNDISATSGSITLDGAAVGGGGGGAHTLISTTNVTTAVAQVDISLSGTYEKYVLTFINVVASGDTNELLRLRVSDDGGSTFKTDTNYAFSGNVGYISQTGSGGSGTISSSSSSDHIQIKDNAAQRDGIINGEIHIYDPHNSSNDFNCFITFVGQMDSAGGGCSRGQIGGCYYVAADYDAIRLYFNGDNMTSGEFKLFGVS